MQERHRSPLVTHLGDASVLFRQMGKGDSLMPRESHGLFDVDITFLIETPLPDFKHHMGLPDDIDAVGIDLVDDFSIVVIHLRVESLFLWNAVFLSRAIHLMLNSEFDKNETYITRDSEHAVHESDFVREVRLFLKSHLIEKVTLDQLARHCHTSTSALSHRYKKETGEPPLTAQHRMRIEHAKALILRGFPLKAIGYDLGYSDEFHLSKAFKRITGISPREFKKQGRG